MKQKLLFALCIMLIAFTFVSCETTEEPGSIYGTYIKNGEPIADERVELYTTYKDPTKTRTDSDGNVTVLEFKYEKEALLLSTKTASDGTFEFQNLVPGYYIIGYSEQSSVIVKVESGRQARVDL